MSSVLVKPQPLVWDPFKEQIEKGIGKKVELLQYVPKAGGGTKTMVIPPGDGSRYMWGLFPYYVYLEGGRMENGHPAGAALIGTFRLDPYPACCAFGVLNGLVVYPPFRCKGVGTTLHQLAIQIARQNKFSGLLAADKLANPGERRILAKFGFQDVYELTNRNTGNQVGLAILNLR